MSSPFPAEPDQGAKARQLERSLADLRALSQVIVEIGRSLDLDTVLRSSLQGIQRVVQGDSGCFLLLRPDTLTLQLARDDSLLPALREHLQTLAREPDLIAHSSSIENNTQIISTVGDRVGAILKAQSVDSYLLLPLAVQGRAIGVLLIVTNAGRLLEPTSVDLLMSIGEQVGMAIENARLHASVREAEEWRRTFMESSPEGFMEGDLMGRLTYVNDAACKILGYERVALLGMRTRDFTVQDAETARAASAQLQQTGVLVNQDAKIVTQSGEIRIVNFTSHLVRDEQEHIVRFQAVCHDVTERRSLVGMLRHRNEELAALNSIAGILSQPLDIPFSLDLVCEQITSITGMEGVGIYLMDESHSHLDLLSSRGLSENLLNQAQRLGLDDLITRRVAVEGQNFAIDDMMLYTEPSLAGPRQEGYHAGIAVPILKLGIPIGGIFVGTRNKSEYERSDIDLLLNVGKQIGQAVENANLYNQMQRRVRELDGLAQLSAACAASLDPLTISTFAVEWTQKLLDVDVADLRLLQGKDLNLIATKAMRPEFTYPKAISLGEQYDLFVGMRSPVVFNDLEKEMSPALEAWLGLRQHGLCALQVVPMVSREHVIGALAAAHSHPYRWSQRETDLLQTIANQVANVVDNAQLFQDVLSEERKIQAIFESGLSGLYATDAEGRIVMFNRAAERATGWALPEVQGRAWQEVFPGADPLFHMALDQKEPAYVLEGRTLKRRDGHIIPVAEAVAPLFDENTRVNGAVGAFWDLSKEKQAEWSREHFLTMVAHQLRSPLSAMLSALQLLERQNLSPARRTELWSVVKSDGVRLKKFADEFLELESTVQSPRPIQLEPLSIVTLVRQLVHQFKKDNPDRHFRVKSSQRELIAFSDSVRVDNILRNLLDNAVRYSPARSLIAVTIRSKEDIIDISVQDEGQGIVAGDRERIFEPFYRSSKLAGQPSDGHGLGLFIARNMVREIEGDIWLDEDERHGTTFHFTVRRYR